MGGMGYGVRYGVGYGVGWGRVCACVSGDGGEERGRSRERTTIATRARPTMTTIVATISDRKILGSFLARSSPTPIHSVSC